jgi:polyhydroxyalkanoate synthesis regulator phasin
MIEIIKKTVLAGLGLAFMTKEKAEATAKKIVKDAKIAEEEGKKFVDEVLKKSEEAKKSLEKSVENIVNSTLQKLDIPSRSEVEKLKKKISELEKKINPS